jgi:hypothetical protein
LKDPKAVDNDVVATLLTAAAVHGDEALFDDLLAAAKGSKDERTRGRLLRALGSFRNPALTKRALGLMLSPDFDPRETMGLLYGPLGHPATRELPYQFVTANYDALVARMGSAMGDFDPAAFLPYSAAGLCSKDRVPEVQQFFAPRMKTRLGGPRNLAQAVESIELCDAMVKSHQAGVREFLSAYRATRD